MALYTLKKTDLNKKDIMGVPLGEILKMNSGVPLKVGAVFNVPTGINAPQPIPNPAGMQGITGVSNTGQGVPNVPMGGRPQANPVVSPTSPASVPIQTLSPAQTVALQYPTPPSVAPTGGRNFGGGFQQPPPSGAVPVSQYRNAPARNDMTIPANVLRAEYPTNYPRGNIGFAPENNPSTQPLREYWWATVGDMFSLMDNAAALGLQWTDFSDWQRQIFMQFASPEWIARYNEMIATGAGGGIGGGGGTGGGGGMGGNGGGYYRSSSGSTYGLINWRL